MQVRHLVSPQAILKQDRAGVSLYQWRAKRKRRQEKRERNRESSQPEQLQQPKTPSDAPRDRSCAPRRSAKTPWSLFSLPIPPFPLTFQQESNHNIYYPKGLQVVAVQPLLKLFGHSGSIWIKTTALSLGHTHNPECSPLRPVEEQLKHNHHGSCLLQVHGCCLTHTRKSGRWGHPIWLPVIQNNWHMILKQLYVLVHKRRWKEVRPSILTRLLVAV